MYILNVVSVLDRDEEKQMTSGQQIEWAAELPTNRVGPSATYCHRTSSGV